MGEIVINPKFNSYKKYRQMNLVNPYKYVAAGDILSNLVKYWKFDNNMTDSIGSQTPSSQSGITYGTGQVNQSGIFNGTSSFALYAANSNLNMSTGTADVPFSVSFWAKPNTTTAELKILDHNTSTSSNFQWVVEKIAGQNNFNLRLTSQSNTSGSHYKFIAAAITFGSWHHYVFTFDGNLTQGMKSYKDGVLVSNTASVVTSYTGMRNLTLSYAIGRRAAQSLSFYTGELDELAVYRRELSAADVLALYNKGFAGLPIL